LPFPPKYRRVQREVQPLLSELAVGGGGENPRDKLLMMLGGRVGKDIK